MKTLTNTGSDKAIDALAHSRTNSKKIVFAATKTLTDTDELFILDEYQCHK